MSVHTAMQLVPVRHLWGITEPWETAIPRIAAAGFSAIEAPVERYAPAESARLRELLAAHALGLVAQGFTHGADVDAHLAALRASLTAAAAWSPRLLNLQSGSDAWSRDEMVRFYREAARITADQAVPVAHETHRGRCFNTPWATRDLITAVPEVQLTADFSHWVCVAERLVLDEDPALLHLVADRTVHIHARVGYAGGPQVPDPRAPEWQTEVAAHERWWDVVWRSMAARRLPECTLTPEFGPAPYMHHAPFTNAPAADLWDICTWQTERQAERFQSFSARSPTA